MITITHQTDSSLLQDEDDCYYGTALSNLNSESGYHIDLGSTFNLGEKFVNKPAIHVNSVYFSTYLPNIEGMFDICEIGSSASHAKFYNIDLKMQRQSTLPIMAI
jgi:hypothetical protein